MKKLAFAFVLSFTMNSAANVVSGSYQGKDQAGNACSFSIGKQWFEDNSPHPLNERIPVQDIQFTGENLSEVIWNVGHPPILNIEKGLVRFNHDLFQQIIATKTGGASLVLLKDEAETAEGHKPLGVIYIEDNYSDRTKSKKLTCTL